MLDNQSKLSAISYQLSAINFSLYFHQHLTVVLDFDQFDYFLECDAV
jgi:hypothetical protein